MNSHTCSLAQPGAAVEDDASETEERVRGLQTELAAETSALRRQEDTEAAVLQELAQARRRVVAVATREQAVVGMEGQVLS